MASATMAEFSDEQIVHEVMKSERQLVTLRFQHSMSALENTATITVVRKQIARLKTEARRREIEQGLSKDSLVHVHSKTFSKADAVGGGVTGIEDGGGFLTGIVDKLTGKD